MNVLIVDDSALVRETLGVILEERGQMKVVKATDPLFALEKMKTWRPDVILLDVDMPRMDGLTFLRKVMAEDPIPVVVCSSLGAAGGEVALDALDAGAVEVVAKGKLGIRRSLEESSESLVELVRRAARVSLPARRGHRPGSPSPARAVAAGPAHPARRLPPGTRQPLVAIGASTGGTVALQEILTAMPADAPPIVVVQHMPEGFTAAFAARLDRLCEIEVKEAEDGDRIRPGLALIAPGNRHLRVRGRGGRYFAALDEGPPILRHRPSVDVLLDSVSLAAGPDAVGIVLTGMGRDGAMGLLAMRREGARTLAQDEASSVVYGMPRAAVEIGAAREVMPLSKIADSILIGIGPS